MQHICKISELYELPQSHCGDKELPQSDNATSVVIRSCHKAIVFTIAYIYNAHLAAVRLEHLV